MRDSRQRPAVTFGELTPVRTTIEASVRGGPATETPASADPAQRARENLVHVLLNHTDFVTRR